jgi:hypothetical protein
MAGRMKGFKLDPLYQGPEVTFLKACLHAASGRYGPPEGEPAFDARTKAAVVRFQAQRSPTGRGDGIVGPATWAMLGAALGYSALHLPPGDAPAWVRNLMLNDPARTEARHIDAATALEMYAFLFGKPSKPGAREGLEFLLRKIDEDPHVKDVRWAAYMLATVMAETGSAFQPIDEDRSLWSQKKYGQPVKVTDGARSYSHVYHGRGYVQLTFRENYVKLGERLGLGRALELDPDKVKQPAVAYEIMTVGMREGLFRGDGTPHALSRFIDGEKCDYVGARDIINGGRDKADEIAGYARKFELILRGSIPAKVVPRHAVPTVAPTQTH